MKRTKEREVREEIKEMRKELVRWREEYEAKTKILEERIMAEKFIMKFMEQRELKRRKEEFWHGYIRVLE